jgi:hypothetical protein
MVSQAEAPISGCQTFKSNKRVNLHNKKFHEKLVIEFNLMIKENDMVVYIAIYISKMCNEAISCIRNLFLFCKISSNMQ